MSKYDDAVNSFKLDNFTNQLEKNHLQLAERIIDSEPI